MEKKFKKIPHEEEFPCGHYILTFLWQNAQEK